MQRQNINRLQEREQKLDDLEERSGGCKALTFHAVHLLAISSCICVFSSLRLLPYIRTHYIRMYIRMYVPYNGKYIPYNGKFSQGLKFLIFMIWANSRNVLP